VSGFDGVAVDAAAGFHRSGLAHLVVVVPVGAVDRDVGTHRGSGGELGPVLPDELREPERDERRRGLGPEGVDLFPDLTRPRIGEPLVGDQLEFGFEFTDSLRQGRVEVDVDVPVGAGAAFARARRSSNAVKGLPPYAAGK
jgi:hypothetical protein